MSTRAHTPTQLPPASSSSIRLPDRLIALTLAVTLVALTPLLHQRGAHAESLRAHSPSRATISSSSPPPSSSSYRSSSDSSTPTATQPSATHTDATLLSHPGDHDASPPSDAELFGELEKIENPTLEDHVAGDLSGAEIIIVVIFLIVFFPIGIILLIVFLVDDE